MSGKLRLCSIIWLISLGSKVVFSQAFIFWLAATCLACQSLIKQNVSGILSLITLFASFFVYSIDQNRCGKKTKQRLYHHSFWAIVEGFRKLACRKQFVQPTELSLLQSFSFLFSVSQMQAKHTYLRLFKLNSCSVQGQSYIYIHYFSQIYLCNLPQLSLVNLSVTPGIIINT